MNFNWTTILSKLDFAGLFKKDPFGNSLLMKRVIISTLGFLTYYRMNIANEMKITGAEYLEELEDENVLFLSNHQTYFQDVIALFHVFCAAKWGNGARTWLPIHFLWPRAKMYYVAASETMKEGLIPKIFAQAGALTVDRSWRANGENVKREVDKSAGNKVAQALEFGWVVSFPQGTTSAYAPVRKGTGHIIKETNPVVVPVVINGFRRAFDKKGLVLKKRNSTLEITFKKPMRFDDAYSIEQIVEKVTAEIEQEMPDWKIEQIKKAEEKKAISPD